MRLLMLAAAAALLSGCALSPVDRQPDKLLHSDHVTMHRYTAFHGKYPLNEDPLALKPATQQMAKFGNFFEGDRLKVSWKDSQNNAAYEQLIDLTSQVSLPLNGDRLFFVIGDKTAHVYRMGAMRNAPVSACDEATKFSEGQPDHVDAQVRMHYCQYPLVKLFPNDDDFMADRIVRARVLPIEQEPAPLASRIIDAIADLMTPSSALRPDYEPRAVVEPLPRSTMAPTAIEPLPAVEPQESSTPKATNIQAPKGSTPIPVAATPIDGLDVSDDFMDRDYLTTLIKE